MMSASMSFLIFFCTLLRRLNGVRLKGWATGLMLAVNVEIYLFCVQFPNAFEDIRVLLLAVLFYSRDSGEDWTDSKDIQRGGGVMSKEWCSLAFNHEEFSSSLFMANSHYSKKVPLICRGVVDAYW
jgi:hypothetical protein